LENSQVSIDVSQVSASDPNSTDKSLSIPMEFKDVFAGSKNLYQLVMDSSGARSDWDDQGDFTVTSSNSAPYNTSVSPNSGSGNSQTFVARWGDADGNSDLESCYFLINSSINGSNGAYILYQPSTNTINLRNDAHSAWLSATVGSATTLENSQVSIDVSQVSASSPNSTDKSLSIPMQFKDSFAGVKTCINSQ
jgi:hypothetical protein